MRPLVSFETNFLIYNIHTVVDLNYKVVFVQMSECPEKLEDDPKESCYMYVLII